MAGGTFGGGNGTTGNPYLVEDAQDLNAVRNYPSGHFKQVANIDLSIYPNLSQMFPNSGSMFVGSYNGQFFEITNFKTNHATSNCGLFGYVSTGGSLKNIKLLGVQVINTALTSLAGGLVGQFNGVSISNCSVTGNITGGSQTGGLVGKLTAGNVDNSYTDVTVSGDKDVGGLIGTSLASSNPTISNCYSKGLISGSEKVGGLFGSIGTANVNNCYSLCNIKGGNAVGGIYGSSLVIPGPLLNNCYSLGSYIERISGTLTNFGKIYGLYEPSNASVYYALDTMEFRG